jgi:hypothetical protein
MALGRWDRALADLESAASWAHADPTIELGIVAAYFQCLGSHPNQLPRWLGLAYRTACDLWAVIGTRPTRAGGAG